MTKAIFPAKSISITDPLDLDGTYQNTAHQRRTTVIGCDPEEVLARIHLDLPVSKHPIDSLNLRDPRFGLEQQLNELVGRYGVTQGQIDLSLDPAQEHAGRYCQLEPIAGRLVR